LLALVGLRRFLRAGNVGLDAAGDPVEVDALEAGRLFDQELLDYTYVLPAELEGCERAEGMTEQDVYFLFRVE